MKNTILLLGVLLLFISTSCSHKEVDIALLPELQQADDMMYMRPDSALRILEQMTVPPASNRFQNATWCLLITQARYKNFVNQSSDSLINIAYNYFMQQDNPQRKALVLYYKGALYEEWADAEQALQCYLDAAEHVSLTTDYQLGYLIQIGIGDIYSARSLVDYAMKAFLEAKHYAELSENKTYISGSLLYLARIYGLKHDWDTTIQYYNEGLKLAKDIGDSRVVTCALCELSGIYYKQKEYSMAIKYAKESISIKEKAKIEVDPDFLTIGKAYFSMEKSDSAFYYLNRVTASNYIKTTASAYQLMYSLSKRNSNYKEAVQYADKYIFYLDSIWKTDRSQALVEIQKKYSEEKLINEKNQLKIEKDRSTQMTLYVSMALFCIIVVIIFIYQRMLLRRAIIIRENEERIRMYALRIHENESLITRNESRMKELVSEIEQNQEMYEQKEEQERVLAEIKKQNESLQEKNKTLHNTINQYSIPLQEKAKLLDSVKSLSDENLYLRARESHLCNQLIKKTEILNNLKQSPEYIESDQWGFIREAIDDLYNNFTLRLSKQFPTLTEGEIRLCCLIKLRFSVSEMGTILAISPPSVSKNKQRLKERIIQGLNHPFEENQTIDLWVWEY